MVQRGDFTVAIACVPCGPRRSLIYAWAWWFCVCWKLSAAEQVKTDCWHTPAVVSTLLTPLLVSCPLTTPLHYNFGAARAGWAERPETTAGWETTAQTAADNPDDDGQPPAPPTTRPATSTTDDPASHQHHRRPRLATNTTDVAVPQLTTPASHQHHRRPRLATITTDVAVPQLTTPASHWLVALSVQYTAKTLCRQPPLSVSSTPPASSLRHRGQTSLTPSQTVTMNYAC